MTAASNTLGPRGSSGSMGLDVSAWCVSFADLELIKIIGEGKEANGIGRKGEMGEKGRRGERVRGGGGGSECRHDVVL